MNSPSFLKRFIKGGTWRGTFGLSGIAKVLNEEQSFQHSLT
jgi:hypothetical protein